MRIAIIQETFHPIVSGSGKRVYEISRRLVKRGHEVYVYTTNQNGIHSELETIDGINVRRIKVSNFITKDNFRIPNRVMTFVKNAFKLILKEYAFDVLEVSNSPLIPTYLSYIFRKKSYKIVNVTLHECWLNSWLKWFKNPFISIPCFYLEYISYYIPDSIISVSHFTARKLTRYMPFLKDKITIIPNGISSDVLKLYNGDINTREEYSIICISRLFTYKKISDLIYAFRKLQLEYPKSSLYIVGTGPEYNKLINLCKSLNLNKVFFLGLMEYHTLVETLRSKYVMVLPSIREGFSIVTLESMAVGTPVIARNSNDSAIHEHITHGENGFLANNIDEMVFYIKLLFENKKLWRYISLNAYNYAKKFSWDKVAIEYENTIERVLNGK